MYAVRGEVHHDQGRDDCLAGDSVTMLLFCKVERFLRVRGGSDGCLQRRGTTIRRGIIALPRLVLLCCDMALFNGKRGNLMGACRGEVQYDAGDVTIALLRECLLSVRGGT